MNDEIKEILDGFDKCLKNYELDKAFGQLSVESIYHLFPHKQLLLKDCITNLQQINNNQAKRNSRQRLANQKQQDLILNLQQIEQDHKETNARLMSELAKLEEENERLKENAIHNDKVVDKAKWNEMIYKSRCEKAREILKKLDLDKYAYTKENRKHTINDLLNILQNGSDSQ